MFALWNSINGSSCTSFCALAEDFSSSALLFAAALAGCFDANLLIRLLKVLILEALGLTWMVSNWILISRTLRLFSGSGESARSEAGGLRLSRRQSARPQKEWSAPPPVYLQEERLRSRRADYSINE